MKVIGMIIYGAWYLLTLYFFVQTVCWFFDIHSWWMMLFAIPCSIAASKIIPLGDFVMSGIVCYFLVTVLQWNLFLAIIFVFPMPVLGLLMLAGCWFKRDRQ